MIPFLKRVFIVGTTAIPSKCENNCIYDIFFFLFKINNYKFSYIIRQYITIYYMIIAIKQKDKS